MLGQSQKVNWFQKCLPSQAAIKGFSETGLSAINHCGIVVSSKTYHRAMYKVTESLSDMVCSFINDATSSGDLLVLMNDDYTNIHTKQQPTDEQTSTACRMATVLLKRFPGIPAILKSDNHININPIGISTKELTEFAMERNNLVSSRFTSVMPPWISALFF